MKNFDNLKPDTNYTVTVTDANGCNVVINFTTNSPTPLPPNAPIISLSEKTSDTISLSWTIPDSDSGIRGYILNVNGADRSETSSNTLTLENLNPSTNYVIKVKAIGNNNLESEWSDVLEVTTNDDLGSPFQMTFRVGDNDSITLPTISTGNYDYTVDWGDGTSDTITSWSDLKRTHNYITAGDYQVSITGLYDRQNFSTNASRNKLISVDNFGDVGWVSFGYAFRNCINLTSIVPIEKFEGEFFNYTFYGCGLTSIPTGLFDNCPNVTNFSVAFTNNKLTSIPDGLFDNCPNVTNFSSMFSGNTTLTGIAPELWLRTNPIPMGGQCFRDCTGLSNYADIPSNWK